MHVCANAQRGLESQAVVTCVLGTELGPLQGQSVCALEHQNTSSAFYQTFKAVLINANISQTGKIEIGEMLPNLFYEASITLIAKPHMAK